jgi:hypothetical protein
LLVIKSHIECELGGSPTQTDINPTDAGRSGGNAGAAVVQRRDVTATAGQDLVGGRAASAASVSRPRCSWEVYIDLQEATNPDG